MINILNLVEIIAKIIVRYYYIQTLLLVIKASFLPHNSGFYFINFSKLRINFLLLFTLKISFNLSIKII